MTRFNNETSKVPSEDTETYVGNVIQQLFEKVKIKNLVMFKRERESCYETIQFIENRLQKEV
jgi:hypothetical protein